MDNNSNKTAATGGIGFTGALAIVFIVLKLCGIIHWPWVWVLSPLWMSMALTLVILLVIIILAIIKVSKERE